MQDKIETVLTSLAPNEDIAVADVATAAATAATLCHWRCVKDGDDEERMMAGRKTVIQVMTDLHIRHDEKQLVGASWRHFHAQATAAVGEGGDPTSNAARLYLDVMRDIANLLIVSSGMERNFSVLAHINDGTRQGARRVMTVERLMLLRCNKPVMLEWVRLWGHRAGVRTEYIAAMIDALRIADPAQVPLEEDGDPEVGDEAIVDELDDLHLQLAGDSDTDVDENDSDASESDRESDDDNGGDELDGHPQDDDGQSAMDDVDDAEGGDDFNLPGSGLEQDEDIEWGEAGVNPEG